MSCSPCIPYPCIKPYMWEDLAEGICGGVPFMPPKCDPSRVGAVRVAPFEHCTKFEGRVGTLCMARVAAQSLFHKLDKSIGHLWPNNKESPVAIVCPQAMQGKLQ